MSKKLKKSSTGAKKQYDECVIKSKEELLDIKPSPSVNDNYWMPKDPAKMLLIAKSNGGKTTVLFNIIRNAWLNYDKLWIFSKTIKDKDYIALMKSLSSTLRKRVRRKYLMKKYLMMKRLMMTMILLAKPPKIMMLQHHLSSPGTDLCSRRIST